MTERQFLEHLRIWQDRLGLDGWEITVRFGQEPKIGDAMTLMRCNRSQYYDHAVLDVHKGAFDPSLLPESMERDRAEDLGAKGWDRYILVEIVHELLHVALRDLMYAGDLVREQCHPAVLDMWDEAWRRAEEALVERTAAALVDSWEA